MATSVLHEPATQPRPVIPETPPPLFPPSAELGHQLQHLADLQAEVDLKKAEELARMREIQDRD
jgi:hypothetical protein